MAVQGVSRIYPHLRALLAVTIRRQAVRVAELPVRNVQLSSKVAGCTVNTCRLIHSSTCMRNDHVFNVQDEKDFDERVRKNATPVVVDFHASWCGPCKLLGPRLESLIAGKQGKVLLAKIDIDELTDLAVGFGVEAVPTVLAMKGGKVVDKFVGLKDDADLESFVSKLTE